jgi:hypothetical protein
MRLSGANLDAELRHFLSVWNIEMPARQHRNGNRDATAPTAAPAVKCAFQTVTSE